MKIHNRKISELIPAEYNPRYISEDAFNHLKASLQRFEAVEPAIINQHPERKDIIVGGHQRLKAATSLGWDEFPCVYVELTRDQEKELNVRLNKNTGAFDFDLLANHFEVEDLVDWGFTNEELFGNDAFEEVEAEEDDYEIPDEIQTDIVLGDLIEIGEHRLLCGDSTDSDQVAKLMNGEKADMVFTDPPYGIGFEYNSHKDTKGEEYLKFCDEWFSNLQLVSDFIFISTGWYYQKFWWNKDPKDCFYWLSKNKRTGGSISHFRKVEPLFIWGKPKNKYNFDFFEQVTEIIEDLKGKHTCPKPISLISEIIKAVNEKDLICDIFLGSGTTMVACHQLGRKCYGMELDPKYCQVIIDRMMNSFPELKVKINGEKYGV
jgi:DNA modification methylase